MKFIAFSDIHYADYGTGVTVEDSAAVERAVTQACIDWQAAFCVFGGDRYLSHEPQDYIRVASDLEQRRRSDAGIVTFSLVGNHDLYAKAPVSGHSNRHLQVVWQDVLPNVVVMDEVHTYRHARVPGVAVHAIPACFEWTTDLLDRFDFRDGEFNLLVFHDMLAGSVIDHRSAHKTTKGRQIHLIDDARFNLVLAGDVHIPQRLPFEHTTGGYIGASIQQSRRDRGDSRGWLQVDTDVGMELMEGPAPRFVDLEWNIEEHGGLPSVEDVRRLVADTYDDEPVGNIVDIVLFGSRESLEAVPSEWHTELKSQLQARRVNPPMRRAILTGKEFVIQSSVAQSTMVSDLESFFNSGRAPIEGYDSSRLLEKATPILAKLGGTDAEQ